MVWIPTLVSGVVWTIPSPTRARRVRLRLGNRIQSDKLQVTTGDMLQSALGSGGSSTELNAKRFISVRENESDGGTVCGLICKYTHCLELEDDWDADFSLGIAFRYQSDLFPTEIDVGFPGGRCWWALRAESDTGSAGKGYLGSRQAVRRLPSGNRSTELNPQDKSTWYASAGRVRIRRLLDMCGPTLGASLPPPSRLDTVCKGLYEEFSGVDMGIEFEDRATQ